MRKVLFDNELKYNNLVDCVRLRYTCGKERIILTMSREESSRRKRRRSRIKNITRFTYARSGFQGWRLSVCRCHAHYTRYFSDRQYGGEQAALAAALEERSLLYEQLSALPFEPQRVLKEFSAKKALRGQRQS